MEQLIFYIGIALFSLCVGSFLNVVIYRYPLMMKNQWRAECQQLLELAPEKIEPLSLLFPRSHCPHCKHPVAWYDNIPLFSYVWLRGACRNCHQKISLRYPFIEIFTMVLSLLVAIQWGMSLQTFAGILLTWCLIAMSFIDLDHQLIPDDLSYPLLWLGLFLNLQGLGLFLGITDPYFSIQQAIYAALLAYISLWLFTKIFYLFTGKLGMGNGDFKLFAGLGAWFGVKLLPFILVFAAISGVIIGVTLIAMKKNTRNTPIPFGPFLGLSGWLMIFLGKML